MKTETAKQIVTTELEYEWGVKYRSCWDAEFKTEWGYSEDPRTSGVIDEEGEVELGSYYHEVVAVGKRVKAPEVWENV